MSTTWMDEHLSDFYVKQAQRDGYPSRAAYKLLEIQAKDKLLTPGMSVVDLGAAPGGWSMVALNLVGSKGRVIAVDCLPMNPRTGVEFIQGDFTEDSILATLMNLLNNKGVDVVLCDMAPNITGQKSVDQPKSMYLAELAVDFAQRVLNQGGKLLVKLFQGEGVDQLVAQLRQCFKQVKIRKPKASRSRSAEIYVLGLGFRG